MGGKDDAAGRPGHCVAKALWVFLCEFCELGADVRKLILRLADRGMLGPELVGALLQQVKVERVHRLTDAAEIGPSGLKVLKELQGEREDRIGQRVGFDTVGIVF